MILSHDKVLRKVEAKVNEKYDVVTTTIISDWPTGINLLDWSLGIEAESSYYYLLETSSLENIYCKATTFYNLFILRMRFFKEEGRKYKRLNL